LQEEVKPDSGMALVYLHFLITQSS